MIAGEEMPRLRRINPRAELWDEGGPLVHLPGLIIRHGSADVKVDAILAPRSHSGYTTRLFLDRPFANRGQNWTVHQIMGATWHTMSFNNVPETLPWVAILAAHVGMLK